MTLQERLQQLVRDEYTIERELGGGGMSSVFLARERAFDRDVVIKVLPEHLAAGMNVERFKREIMMAAGLQHPHIVGVLSAGEIDGLPFFVMPYVAGDSLRARLEQGPLGAREAVDVLKDVARGLAYAHGRGIVHRDIKPDNILLSGGAATITDFGVAKAVGSARGGEDPQHPGLTQAGTSLGTPAYMAPEQAAGQSDVDHRADIYSLGVTAYEMLSGKPPFHELSFARIIAAHISKPAPPLDVDELPSGLRRLVMRCLEKDPADRPASAEDLVRALDEPDIFSGAGWPAGSAGPARRLRTVGVGAVAVAVAAIGGFFFARAPGDAGTSTGQAVAVLPFVNVSGDTADAYFADGMTDELITALQRVPGLRVASRTAAFSFRGSAASVNEIGAALGVSSLLEGTVRRGGERLRVSAQLVNASDGLALWSQTFETRMRDVFAVQDSIARAIVAALEATFGVGTGAVRTTRGTDDLEAYDLYLRGRYFFAQRGEEGLRRAVDFFRQAIARDTAYASAYTGLADAYGLLPLYAGTPPDSVLPAALAAADRAIALDSTLAEAFTARASLLVSSREWERAERDYQRALALDPEYATAHQWYGELLTVMGRFPEAVAALARATALDPLSPVMAGSYAGVLVRVGRVDEALVQARRAVDLSPVPVTHMFLGNVLFETGKPSDAVAEFQETLRGAPGLAGPRGLLAAALATSGDTAGARAELRALLEQPDGTGHQAAIARAYAALGPADSALNWLERGLEAGDPFYYAEGLGSVVWDALRDRPRFRLLLERLRLDPARFTN